MENKVFKFFAYLFLLIKEWILWIFGFIDLIGFLAIYFYLDLKISQVVYWIVGVIQILISGYVVYEKKDKFTGEQSRKIEQDQENLRRIIKMIPPSNLIHYLREVDFAGAFDLFRFDGLFKFIDEFQDPTFEFINPRLEKFRKELFNEINELSKLIGQHTFVIDTSEGVRWSRIPKEYSYTRPDYFKQISKQMNNLADNICAVYDKLIHTGRRL